MARKGPTSPSIRRMSWTWFRCVPIGGRFRHTSEIEWYGSGMKCGVCEKISARKYRYVDDGMECQIGSIDCVVVNVDAEGEMIRCGETQISLRD